MRKRKRRAQRQRQGWARGLSRQDSVSTLLYSTDTRTCRSTAENRSGTNEAEKRIPLLPSPEPQLLSLYKYPALACVVRKHSTPDDLIPAANTQYGQEETDQADTP